MVIKKRIFIFITLFYFVSLASFAADLLKAGLAFDLQRISRDEYHIITYDFKTQRWLTLKKFVGYKINSCILIYDIYDGLSLLAFSINGQLQKIQILSAEEVNKIKKLDNK